MNEITRIHIAKVPYDIEVSAKKELEKYIEKLALYADDKELLADIEIRITELLIERGIERDGIIAAADVAAIRTQLGDPKEFIGDGDIAVGSAAVDDGHPRRRLYRDPDTAVVGGVLSGMAKYFDTNPLWTRLTFIILLFVSFGAALAVYLILWAIIPPARTAAEKLELAGKPITLGAIKELSEQSTNDEARSRTARVVQQVLIYGGGAILAFGALLALLATVGAVWAGVYWQGAIQNAFALAPATIVITYVLFVISGLLLTALLTILARALFKKRWTKKTGVAVAAIVAGGIIAFGAGLLIYGYGQWQARLSATTPQSVSRVSLPGITATKTLAINSETPSVTVVYTVDNHPRYELTGAKNIIKPEVSIDGTSATVRLKTVDSRNIQYVQPILQIYGPALDSLTVTNGSVSYYNEQPSLSVTVHNGSLTIGGTYATVSAITTDGSASIDMSGASITDLTASTQFGAISAGVVKNLTLAQPEACPSRTTGTFSVSAVTSGTLRYNGASREARSFTTSCGGVTIGEDTLPY